MVNLHFCKASEDSLKLSRLILSAFAATLPLVGSIIDVTSLGDTGAGTLRAAIASANSGDIIVFGIPGTITLNSLLAIGVNLTIDGSGSSIAIDGNSGTIFNITGANSVTFSTLTLLNASTAITGFRAASISLLNSTILGGSDGLTGVNATVTNSTFSGNTGTAIGGATVSLFNSTIAGGNIGIENTLLTIGNTIVYGNTTDVGAGNAVTDSGHNLIGNGGGLFFNGTNGDIVGANPLLGPLANNGGPTLTIALLPGSPAIDAGNNAIIPPGVTTDQRGPGFARIAGGTVDIGAFETPEPATYVTCLLGLAIGAWRLRKR
jgi:hypothetical protein